MTGRAVLVAFLAALVPAASVAQAGTVRAHSKTRTCRLVTDERGDANAGPMGVGRDPFGSEPAYDLLSADIASDEDTVTAVLRVADLDDMALAAPLGIHWRLDFTAVGSSTSLFLQGFATPFGQKFDAGYVESGMSVSFTGTDVTGVLDPVRNEVRISAPVDLFNQVALIYRGATIDHLAASSGRFYNTAGTHPSVSEHTDEATGAQSYTAGAPSCVPVGR